MTPDITHLSPQDAMAQARAIALAVKSGKTAYADAERLAKPLLDIANQQGRAVAAKYGKKHRPITFRQLVRV